MGILLTDARITGDEKPAVSNGLHSSRPAKEKAMDSTNIKTILDKTFKLLDQAIKEKKAEQKVVSNKKRHADQSRQSTAAEGWEK